MGREPDRWASPVTYASLQVLQQAIEKVGKIDREAVIKEINTGTFDTIIGKVKLVDNLYKGIWAVGQWQGSEFYGIAPKQDGARAPIVPEAGLAVGRGVNQLIAKRVMPGRVPGIQRRIPIWR